MRNFISQSEYAETAVTSCHMLAIKRTAVSGSSHSYIDLLLITHDYLLLMAFDDSLFMAANVSFVMFTSTLLHYSYAIKNKKKNHESMFSKIIQCFYVQMQTVSIITLNKRTEFKEALLLIQASFAVCISKYKFNE
ncbi:hypothetical protein T06_12105 [Trichinella sp. T6]|nr:hypothetical protein T06_12105 [Trichinella sp. T6]